MSAAAAAAVDRDMEPPNVEISRSASTAGLSSSVVIPPAVAVAHLHLRHKVLRVPPRKINIGLTQSVANTMKLAGELKSAAKAPSLSREVGIVVGGSGWGVGIWT
jgi:hypothetical protein